MSKLDELIKKLCSDGVEYKRLGEIGEFYGGLSGKSKKDFSDGNYPYISYMNVYQHISVLLPSADMVVIKEGEKQNRVQYGDILFTGSSETPEECGFSSVVTQQIDYPLYLNSFSFGLRLTDRLLLNPEFAKYVFRSHNVRKQIIRTANGVTRFNVSKSKMKNVRIPVPPLEVQSEIVKILDNFTELTTELTMELTTELTARKKQYEYYRNRLLTFDTASHIKKVKLGDVAKVTKLAGFEFTKYVTYVEKGHIIALRGLNVKNGNLDLCDVKYIDGSDLSKLERSKLHVGDMLFTYVGTIGQVALIDKEDTYYLAPNVALIRADKNVLLPEYMRFYFQSSLFWDTQIKRLLQSSSMKNIPMEKIRKFELLVPPIDVQRRLVHVLDNFDKVCNDLHIGLPAEIEARKKQYEFYRDSLLTFLEKGESILTEQNRTEQN